VTVARQVLRDYSASDDLWPTEHPSGRSPPHEAPSTSSTKWEPVIDVERLSPRMDERRLPGG
jgi:hypothetical protein